MVQKVSHSLFVLPFGIHIGIHLWLFYSWQVYSRWVYPWLFISRGLYPRWLHSWLFILRGLYSRWLYSRWLRSRLFIFRGLYSRWLCSRFFISRGLYFRQLHFRFFNLRFLMSNDRIPYWNLWDTLYYPYYGLDFSRLTRLLTYVNPMHCSICQFLDQYFNTLGKLFRETRHSLF